MPPVIMLLPIVVSLSAAAPTTRVMSFNIRFDNPKDGEDRWSLRREAVVRTIRAFNPDVLGMQEVLASQADALRADLPDYGFVGVGRDDGKRGGEFAPIMYRQDRFKLVDQGHTWLCDEPNTPGKLGWDAVCPRMATWVRLQPRAGGDPVVVINTHFDHVGRVAQRESAKLIRALAGRLGGDRVIVTGDFNARPGSEPHAILTASDAAPPQLRDSYTVADGDEEAAGTFNGFKGSRKSARIDWILVGEDFKVQATSIDRTSFQREGKTRYPSDHFPVTAVLTE